MIGCLIIHGYTGGPYELEPLTNYLEDHTNWYIKVPVLPGHGENLALDDISYQDWMDTAENAILHLREKCDTIYVIGFSMGGMIAVYLAAKYKIDKLVLLATARKYLSLSRIMINIGDVIEDGIKGNIRENQYFVHYKKKFGVVPMKANLEFMKLVHLTRKYLKDVEAPVLIAQGQMDSIVPYKTAYYLDREIGSEHKEVVFFEKSSHLICLGDDKDILNSMVYDFLAEPVSIEK